MDGKEIIKIHIEQKKKKNLTSFETVLNPDQYRQEILRCVNFIMCPRAFRQMLKSADHKLQLKE